MPSERPRAWADTRLAGNALVAGADLILNLLIDAPTVDTLTSIRVVGEINAHYIISNTITDSDSIVDLGIGVASGQAFAVGQTALADPAGSTGYPPRGWVYCQSLYCGQAVTSSTGMFNENAIFKFDVRGQRKIDKGVLFLRMVNTNINVGGAMEVVGRVRVLCLT